MPLALAAIDAPAQRRLRYALTRGRDDLVKRALVSGAQAHLATEAFWNLASRAPQPGGLDALAEVLPLPTAMAAQVTAAVEANRPTNVLWWRDRGAPWVEHPCTDSILISALLAGHVDLVPWLGARGATFPAHLTWSPLVHAFAHPPATAVALIHQAVAQGADPRQVSRQAPWPGNVLQAWVAHQAHRNAPAEAVWPLWEVLTTWVDADATSVPDLPSARAQVIATWGTPEWLLHWTRAQTLSQRSPAPTSRERARS